MYDKILREIDRYAGVNYTKGWDGWVECLSEDEKIEVFEGKATYSDCFKLALNWVADYAETAYWQAEACALYDVNPKFYDSLAANAENCRKAANGG
jgi:hypothetical protein